jgi:predicted transposase/invertase (TIGR01784 family)
MMNDIIFKIVFGQKSSEPLLRILLNALLMRKGDERIEQVTILNPQLDKKAFTDKGVMLDVTARDHAGRLYNIEVQLTQEEQFVSRSIYYLARLLTEQLRSGSLYEELPRCIGIFLLDYRLFPGLEDLHSVFRFYDTAHAQELSDLLEMHYIELVKFKKDSSRALRTPFERWLHVLKFGELYERKLEPLPASLRKEEGVTMAIDKMREARSSSEVREIIHAREKAIRDHEWRLANAIKREVKKLEEKAEERVNEMVNEMLNERINKAEEKVKKAEEKVKRAEEKVEEKVKRAEEKAKRAEERVERAEAKAEEKAKRAEEKAEEKAKRAEEKAEEKVKRAEEKAEKALKKGLEQGLEESRREIALGMLAEGVEPRIIQKLTGLDPADLN